MHQPCPPGSTQGSPQPCRGHGLARFGCGGAAGVWRGKDIGAVGCRFSGSSWTMQGGSLEAGRVPEHPRASQCNQSIPAQPPPFGGGGPRQPSAPHLAFFPPPQTSTSARLTAPATTSASTPPGASSASATRATHCTASPTAEVGPGGCWVPTSPMGSGPGGALGTPRNGAAPRHGRCGPLGLSPRVGLQGPGGAAPCPRRAPGAGAGWGGRAQPEAGVCDFKRGDRNSLRLVCSGGEGRNPRRFWQGAGTGWGGEHQKGLSSV